MAVKKLESGKNGATPTKKPTAAKKAAAPKAAKAKPAAAPKAAKAKPAAAKGAAKAKPKAAPVKLTDRQLDLLKTIHGTKEEGYVGDKKAEAKTLEALQEKKLIKRGAKDKEKGHYRYTVSKAGEKHLSTVSPATSA